jgi:thiosulfate/3-mercaptopyruvate sulfurtransferase
LELYEKIYVHPSFLETDHGEIACSDCHGGKPADPNWQTAHTDLVKDPTLADAEAVCGECHDQITTIARHSLHATLAPFAAVINTRTGDLDAGAHHQINTARNKHCSACHASCGQCHISRPAYVGGGFLSRHLFLKTPPMDTTCASCHGGRVHGEFTGADQNYHPDVHYEDEEMTCMDCHTAAEMHADARGVVSRFNLPQRPDCRKCHAQALSKAAGNRSHDIHAATVACQVCHAQANKNCFSCHVGTDRQGLPFFKCKKTVYLFKIGLNASKSENRPYDWVVLRHPPANPGLFDHYVKDGLPNFSSLPTWKLDTPHSIRRITERNKTCNGCHGNPALFLSPGDLEDWEREANATVVVPAERIPERVTPDEKGG